VGPFANPAVGLRSLRGQAWPAPSLGDDSSVESEREAHADSLGRGEGESDNDDDTRLDNEFAAIDAVLPRSNAAIEHAKQSGPATSGVMCLITADGVAMPSRLR